MPRVYYSVLLLFFCLLTQPKTCSQTPLPDRSATLYLEKALSLALVFPWAAKNAVLSFQNVTTVPPPVNKGCPLWCSFTKGRSLSSFYARKPAIPKGQNNCSATQLCRDLEQKAAVPTSLKRDRC